jgi:purine-binding chemotaxis protein CheW
MNLNTILGLPDKEIRPTQKIIVLVPEAANGSNVGIIVDDVSSVTQISESDVETMGDGYASEFADFVKGIIKTRTEGDEKKSKSLIIWLDIQKVLKNLATK